MKVPWASNVATLLNPESGGGLAALTFQAVPALLVPSQTGNDRRKDHFHRKQGGLVSFQEGTVRPRWDYTSLFPPRRTLLGEGNHGREQGDIQGVRRRYPDPLWILLQSEPCLGKGL